MFTVRKADERGVTDFGWLDSRHTFSFGDYRDPRHVQFRALRVINDDRVAPGGGFPTHPHRDMEIFTCVLSGELAHKDSMGNGTTIRPGEWQKMSAGTGVLHSEFNPSAADPVHLLQIWVFPDTRGVPPAYAQTLFPEAERRGRWRLVASPDGRDGSLPVRQDMTLWATVLHPDERVTHELKPGRGAWLHVATGAVTANGYRLAAGDGAAVEDEATIEVVGDEAGEVLLFDLA